MQREKNVRGKVYTHNIKFRTSNPMDKYIWDWCGNQDQLHSSVVMAIKMAIALYGKGDLPQAVQQRTFMNARNKLNSPQPVQTAPIQSTQTSANVRPKPSITPQPQTDTQPKVQRPKPKKKVKVQFHQPKQYKQSRTTGPQNQTQQRDTSDESDDEASKKDASSLMKQLGNLDKNK